MILNAKFASGREPVSSACRAAEPRSARLVLGLIAAAAAVAVGLPIGATGEINGGARRDTGAAPGRGGSRTLVLALDGVPFRLVERARARGAFGGWPAPVPLVAPFPTMTNVSFSSMLRPFGVARAAGYEVQHYSPDENGVVGGTLFGYRKRLFPWRKGFDIVSRSVGAKVAVYAAPRRKLTSGLAEIEQALAESPCELFLAHLGSTDAVQHLRGDEVGLELLLEVDRWLVRLTERHAAEHGGPLRLVLLSDHGNTAGKVRGIRGLRRHLRQAGLRSARRLEHPDDVIAPTFGVVGYGALYTRTGLAERAARAVSGHPAVALAAWRSAADEVRVISRRGSGRVRWRETNGRRELAYGWLEGDPLELAAAVASMRAGGLVDGEGFASEAAWLERTVEGPFPDAPRRLVDAFAEAPVETPATVLFSLLPGRAWGWQSAAASSWLAGGRLEGTHGGLDRESTLGFYISNTEDLSRGGPVVAEEALLPLRDTWRRAAACREINLGEHGGARGGR